jgi:hypothetical protein
MTKQDLTIPVSLSGVSTSVKSVSRTWSDVNGNYIPDCDLTNPLQNGVGDVCGQINDLNFGLPNPKAVRWDPGLINGSGVRDYTWDFTVEVQHAFTRKVGATIGYYRNWFSNFRVTDNIVLNPATDYDTYCVTGPADPRLPNGGGLRQCGFYDVTKAAFSRPSQSVILPAKNFGNQTQVNDFFGADLNAAFGQGGKLTGGFDIGRSESNSCFTVDNPTQQTYILTGTPTYCHTVVPWKANLQVKLNASYPLFYGITASGNWRTQAGAQDTASYQASNLQISESLGRDLAACGTRVGAACTAQVNIPLIQPGTRYEPRRYQTDVRLSKTVRLGPKMRVQGNLDVYNLLNANSVTAVNTTYGPQWLKPLDILSGRSIQFSANLNY